MNDETRNELTVKLPCVIGTVVETYQKGQKFTDKVRQYIVSDEINVILDINCDASRPSTPISLEEFKQRWKTKRLPMTIELPYEVNTIVRKANESSSDKVFSYTINEGNDITVVLQLNIEEKSRLSVPIGLEEFKENWKKA